MKIFLTGGSGFIGRNFIKKALKNGHFIYATTRKKIKYKNKKIKWLKGEFCKGWEKELKNSDVLVHLAAAGVYNKKISLKNSIDVNFVKSIKLLINAIKSGCKKWIIVGSCFENFLHSKTNAIINYYSLSKFIFSEACWKIAKEYNCKCRLMKLFHVYGKDENKNRLYPSLINSIKKKTSFHMTRGTQINDFVHIDKVTDILLDSLDFKKRNSKFPQYWEIGTGKNIQTKIFVKNILDQFFIKKKIMFGKIKKNSHNYFSNKKFIWKIN